MKGFPGPQCIWDYLLRTALRSSQSDKETNQWTIEVVPRVGTGRTASLVAEGTVGAGKGYLTEAVLGLSLEGSASSTQGWEGFPGRKNKMSGAQKGFEETASLAVLASMSWKWLIHKVSRLLSNGVEFSYEEPLKGLSKFVFYENLRIEGEIG